MAGVGVDRGCCWGQGCSLDVAWGRSRDEPWMWLALGVGMYLGCGWGRGRDVTWMCLGVG